MQLTPPPSVFFSWFNFLQNRLIGGKRSEKQNKMYKTLFDSTHQSDGTRRGAGVGFVRETERLWSPPPPSRSCVFKESCGLLRRLRSLHSSTPVRRQEWERPHPLPLRPPPQQAAKHLQAPLGEPEPRHSISLPFNKRGNSVKLLTF